MPLHDNLKPDPSDIPKPVKMETAEDLKNALALIFSTREGQLHLKAAIAGDNKKKPSTWRGRTNAPYYRERFALEIKRDLDSMIKEYEEKGTADPLEYRYDESNLSRHSLYLKVNQASLYLREELDFEGVYKRFFQMVSVTRERNGVRITLNKDLRSHVPQDLRATRILPKDIQTSVYKQKLETFLLESKEGEVLEIDNLSLLPEEMQVITASLAPLDNFMARITSRLIKVRHLTEEEILKLKNS
jgi:hypothetical protein